MIEARGGIFHRATKKTGNLKLCVVFHNPPPPLLTREEEEGGGNGSRFGVAAKGGRKNGLGWRRRSAQTTFLARSLFERTHTSVCQKRKEKRKFSFFFDWRFSGPLTGDDTGRRRGNEFFGSGFVFGSSFCSFPFFRIIATFCFPNQKKSNNKVTTPKKREYKSGSSKKIKCQLERAQYPLPKKIIFF